MATRTTAVGVAQSARVEVVTIGEVTEGVEAIDRRRLLEEAFPRQDQRLMRKDNKTGFRGVLATRSGRWRARIKIDGKTISLGYYHTVEEAARAYDRAARILYNDQALTNF